MTTLISFLGKGQDGCGYRPTCYQFEDGWRFDDQKYLGQTLAEKLCPSRIILLGTPGSMWDVFLEGEAESLETQWLELADAVPKQAVNRDLLSPFEHFLSKKLNCTAHCELIPYARTTVEQLNILSRLAELLEKDEQVVIDVTHGFRHLPMLGLVAARFLRKIKNISVNQIYYGAFEMTADQTTPVLELRGLLELLDWVDALGTFDKDGDYGVFADLLTKQGLASNNAALLRRASFHERTSNSSQATQALSTVSAAIAGLDTPLFNLFKQQLAKRLSWFRKATRGQREMQLARDYLARGDFLRATIYGLEGLISNRITKNGKDENNFLERKDVSETLKDSTQFNQLNYLRNALAHGVRPDVTKTTKVLKNEESLQQSLQELFDDLLD